MRIETYFISHPPFEARAMELILLGNLIATSVLEFPLVGVIFTNLEKETEYIFEYSSHGVSEEFWEQVVNRLEVADAIGEL